MTRISASARIIADFAHAGTPSPNFHRTFSKIYIDLAGFSVGAKMWFSNLHLSWGWAPLGANLGGPFVARTPNSL
jgi:hypothetical protein